MSNTNELKEEIALIKVMVDNMTENRNPYAGMPCNYQSYGDYCPPETCWCNKKEEWLRKNNPEKYYGKNI